MTNSKSTAMPWAMWGLAITFYFYQYFIRVAPGVLRSPLTLEFNLNATEYGTFVSCGLLAYASLQIPVGIALSKWGARRVITVCALLCSFGTFLMSIADSYTTLCMARFLIGAGSSAAFVGTFKMASDWFSPQMLPILVGVTSSVGVIGASVAGAPLVWLESQIGWRSVFGTLSIIAVAVATLIALFLRDKKVEDSLKLDEIKKVLKTLCFTPQVWLLGIIGFMLYTPISVFADLWGPSFVMKAYDVPMSVASVASSCVYYGNAIAAYFVGVWFTRFNTNRTFFLLFTTLISIVMLVFVWGHFSNGYTAAAFLFVVGCLVSSENMVFPLGAQYVPKAYASLSASFVNFLIMMGPMFLQPGVGMIMDFFWEGALENGAPAYSVHEYQLGVTVIVGVLMISALLSLFLKGKPVQE